MIKDLWYSCCVAIQKPFIHKQTQLKRYTWAVDHQHWDKHDFSRVIFTDKLIMQCGRLHQQYITRHPDKCMDMKCLLVKFGKQWSCML